MSDPEPAKEVVMLKVHVRNLGGVAILCLQGRIVRGETETLRKAVYTQWGVSAVVLDLARVSTIDAGGLGVMLELRELIQSRGIAFKLTNVTNLVSYLLEVTRLNSVFEVTSGAEIAYALALDWPAKELAQCA
jgi:anti-anti-sigma factor